MKILLQILFISLTIWNCDSKDNLEHRNYQTAINNESTVQNFIVISVKNINTNETKNICTTGNFLMGAIHHELNLKYDALGRKEAKEFALSKPNQYFKFKDKEALKNINFYNYNEDNVNNEGIKSIVKSIEEELNTKENYSIKLDTKEMLAVSHNLIKKGFLCSENSCFGGNLIIEKIK